MQYMYSTITRLLREFINTWSSNDRLKHSISLQKAQLLCTGDFMLLRNYILQLVIFIKYKGSLRYVRERQCWIYRL